MPRQAWLAGLRLYALAAGIDFAYHLIEDLRSGDEALQFSEIVVAFSGALFWPIDVVAIALLSMR
jgi:hypothetical protein